ncbi:hypothetical protein BpHYR1_034255 [Brachionus plicatilis]|uniref:Uncharacterized protein n=1 Tax=Brachionus plicatilis TaxID=10195 RepID=A0A3M7RAT9_BRAPC|nr:hypothetical protein BpHYR1_034255 [Brachionus plicatilis]
MKANAQYLIFSVIIIHLSFAPDFFWWNNGSVQKNKRYNKCNLYLKFVMPFPKMCPVFVHIGVQQKNVYGDYFKFNFSGEE